MRGSVRINCHRAILKLYLHTVSKDGGTKICPLSNQFFLGGKHKR